MISIKRIKEIFQRTDMSDEEAIKIQTELYEFAKLMFEMWRFEMEQAKKNIEDDP